MARQAWAYHDANGRPLRGPCKQSKSCLLLSKPGGAKHDGPHRPRKETKR